MKESINIWGIKEYEGDGESCPITPVNLPLHKKIILFFFRFGICPMCVTMSILYNLKKYFQTITGNRSKGTEILKQPDYSN
jgi:hypothetical protein